MFATDAIDWTNFCAAQNLTQFAVRFRWCALAGMMKGHEWAADHHVVDRSRYGCRSS